MHRSLFWPGFLALSLVLPHLAQAADKSAYNLFHPVPRAELREFDTDRPDRTEAPYTVDAGHFQIETELFGYVKGTKEVNGVEEKYRITNLGTLNLKAGLLSDLELQTIFPTYGRITTTSGADREVRQGSGDLRFRLKYNVLGNDEGEVAMAVMPWVEAPTGRKEITKDKWEGGVIVPLLVHLPHGIDLETMIEWAKERNEGDNGYHNVFESSLALEHRIWGKFGGFVELFAEATDEKENALKATFDAGLVYTIGHNMQLDAGVNIGMTKAAEDLNPFVGFSYRL